MWTRGCGHSPHGGDSSRFLSGCPDSPSCCMHAFYTQSRIFRNFSACPDIPKLAFCPAKGGLVGVCAVGSQAITNACSSCSNLPVSLYKYSELSFYATIHISSDFGHVSNSNHSAVAAALLCSWRCTGRLRSRIRVSETVARAVVLACRQPFAY